MFHSFFPRPRLFFSSFAGWALFTVLLWYFTAKDWGNVLSLGGIFDLGFPAELADDADDAAKAAYQQAVEGPASFWLYQYMLICYLSFAGCWMWLSPHRWSRWSVLGSALIIFVTWYEVQLDVLINEWFGRFFNLIQKALTEPGSVTSAEYYGEMWTITEILFILVMLGAVSRFFVSHYIFRWRTAMNDYYTSMWPRLRHIEGASQRVQEDTMRFAQILEALGVSFVDSVMTLIAYLPILWALSVHVKELPIIGEVSQALVFIAIIWALAGTVLLAAVGIKLPGLEFRNQRVEAAYRKELVFGEDNADRAQPPTVGELFANVRQNYFRLYFHYLYFNVFRISYIQVSILIPYIALGPAVVAGTITFGIIQQILRAFNRVERSFQYLVYSWPTIVDLLSIYKRLQAFEATLKDQPLPDIDQEFLASAEKTP